MEIILLGYMGSGKSTIARQLSQKLNLEMIDLDDYIATKEQNTISSIFKNKGEIYFRKLEIKALNEILTTKKNYVLALGGGTPCYANNMEAISAHGISIYLKGSIQTLRDRLILEKEHRPLIKDLEDHQLIEFIAKHLFERNPFYEKATHTLKIDEKDSQAIIDEITSNML